MGQEAILIVLIVLFAVFMFWSSRRRKRQAESTRSEMQPGVRVMLSFGLYGTIVSIDEEQNTATVEIAKGVVVTVHRQTLARVAQSDETGAVGGDSTLVHTDTTVHTDSTLHTDSTTGGEPQYGERASDGAAADERSKRDGDR